MLVSGVLPVWLKTVRVEPAKTASSTAVSSNRHTSACHENLIGDGCGLFTIGNRLLPVGRCPSRDASQSGTHPTLRIDTHSTRTGISVLAANLSPAQRFERRFSVGYTSRNV